MNDQFPYELLGLNKGLEDFRTEYFARLTEVHQEYITKGWLPHALNQNRGPIRGMSELGNFARHKLHQDITKLIPQCFPIYAEGPWLDLHAVSVGLTRKPALQATGEIIFSRNKSGGNLKIPAGRLVKTKPDGLGKVYRFVTTAEVVMPEGAFNVAAPVIAEDYGQASNVTVGAICEIVTSIGGVDEVINSADWLTSEGADEEKDESLRQRYVLAWRSIGGLNKYFYESLAMSVPGVAAVQVNDRHPRGQGTVDVIIKGAAGMPTQSLIDKVAEVIEENRPQIDKVLVLEPKPTPVILKLLLKVVSGNHETIKLEAENRIRAMFQPGMEKYGKLLKIGEDLTHSRIHSEVMKITGLKSVVIESPATDVIIPMGGLATLQSLTINSAAEDE